MQNFHHHNYILKLFSWVRRLIGYFISAPHHQKTIGTVVGCTVVSFEGCGQGFHNRLADSRNCTVRGLYCILLVGPQHLISIPFHLLL